MGGMFGVPGMIIGVPVFALLGKLINTMTDKRLSAKTEDSVSEDNADSEASSDAAVKSDIESDKDENAEKQDEKDTSEAVTVSENEI